MGWPAAEEGAGCDLSISNGRDGYWRELKMNLMSRKMGEYSLTRTNHATARCTGRRGQY